jgi:RecA-family ATPase
VSPIRNGAYLDGEVFPDPSWCVPGIIPEGCCILSGHPKIGKSFLVLAIALAAASGGTVLGVEVEARPVLYLALEDEPRRLQLRSRILLDDQPLPVGFSYLTRDDTEGAMNLAKDWVDTHRTQKPLVIVDTLEKIRGARSQNAYADDYKAGTSLQSLLAKSGTVIAVHHNRKGESEDFLDNISGTLALSGSVDTVITLNRKRTESSGLLNVTGRDVDEMIYKLNFVNGHWLTDGDDLAEAAQRATTKKFGPKMQETLDAVNAGLATTSREVAELLEVPEPTARKYLSRLATEYRLIERTGIGSYGPVTVSQPSQAAASGEELLTSA